MCESKIVLYLEGPEEVMVKRLQGRGRTDDNEETIKKRLRVNKRDAEPVVEYFDKEKKLARVNCDDTPEGSLIAFDLVDCIRCLCISSCAYKTNRGS